MLLYIVVIVVDVLYAVRTPRQTSPLADGTLLLKLKFIYLSIYLSIWNPHFSPLSGVHPHSPGRIVSGSSLDRLLMVRHGMGMHSEPGMSRSPLYVLECDFFPGTLDLLLEAK